jgi:hypothetical protein
MSIVIENISKSLIGSKLIINGWFCPMPRGGQEGAVGGTMGNHANSTAAYFGFAWFLRCNHIPMTLATHMFDNHSLIRALQTSPGVPSSSILVLARIGQHWHLPRWD